MFVSADRKRVKRTFFRLGWVKDLCGECESLNYQRTSLGTSFINLLRLGTFNRS